MTAERVLLNMAIKLLIIITLIILHWYFSVATEALSHELAVLKQDERWNWHSFTNVIWESWERWKMLLGTWLLKSKVVKVVRAMVSLGSTVFFICKGKEGKVKLRGTVVGYCQSDLSCCHWCPPSWTDCQFSFISESWWRFHRFCSSCC